ncbi:MAG: DUF2971 domain-containing protein [Lachnospiraceae bacterium]|nr:DUF2971 domain-containing protein [Lachnospiraceae bacterium]
MKDSIYNWKWEIIKKYMERLDEDNPLEGKFIHYTSINSAFAILDGDTFWASNVRFSNDATEERMLKLDGLENRDDYIICFCSENDMLSQWRGYCHNGGVAIKLNLNYTQEYSILHADYETSGNYIIYENTPLPVIYLNQKDNPEQVRAHMKNDINSCGYASEILLEDMLPYLKNGHFREEREMRMIFSNRAGLLSKCIRFRTLPDGVKVPYIVIKHGNMGKMKGACTTDISQYDNEKIMELSNDREPIWIEEGYDQEAKYFEMLNHVECFQERTNWRGPISVLCKGKLPIEEITVAPTYDRERKVEQIRRFCQSKYWLKNVVVKASNIPYIQPLL